MLRMYEGFFRSTMFFPLKGMVSNLKTFFFLRILPLSLLSWCFVLSPHSLVFLFPYRGFLNFLLLFHPDKILQYVLSSHIYSMLVRILLLWVLLVCTSFLPDILF